MSTTLQRLGPAAILAMACALVCACANSGSNDHGPTLSAFRLVDQVDGWQEDSYTEFDANTMYALVDGAAVPHVENGLVAGFVQLMKNTADRNLEAYVEEFATAPWAKAVFELQVSGLGETFELTAFAASEAVAGRILGGAMVYAHWDRFYFALTMTGYPSGGADEDALVVNDVQNLLQFYAGLEAP